MRNFLLALLVFGLPVAIEFDFATPRFLRPFARLFPGSKRTHFSSVR
jgi:hypothetical protein